MLIPIKAQASEEGVRRIREKIGVMGFRPHPIPGAQLTAIGTTDNPRPPEPVQLESRISDLKTAHKGIK